MNKEVKILAMPVSAKIDAAASKRLSDMGVVIVRCDNPELVRLLRPTDDVDILPANEFMWAAVDALSAEVPYNDSDKIRRRFLKNIADRTYKRITESQVSTPPPDQGADAQATE